MGEIFNNEVAVGKEDGPGLSIGVDVPCSDAMLEVPVSAEDGPGFPGTCRVSAWAFVLACFLSAKQKFSILLLFLLYSPTVLQATELLNLSLGSRGLGCVLCVFRLCVLMVTVWGVLLSFRLGLLPIMVLRYPVVLGYVPLESYVLNWSIIVVLTPI